MSTPAPDNGTHGSPAASRAEPRSRKDLPAWRKLEEHADRMGETTLRVLFDSDPERASSFAVEDLGMYAGGAGGTVRPEGKD